jgi:hypothetical protein
MACSNCTASSGAATRRGRGRKAGQGAGTRAGRAQSSHPLAAESKPPSSSGCLRRRCSERRRSTSATYRRGSRPWRGSCRQAGVRCPLRRVAGSCSSATGPPASEPQPSPEKLGSSSPPAASATAAQPEATIATAAAQNRSGTGHAASGFTRRAGLRNGVVLGLAGSVDASPRRLGLFYSPNTSAEKSERPLFNVWASSRKVFCDRQSGTATASKTSSSTRCSLPIGEGRKQS